MLNLWKVEMSLDELLEHFDRKEHKGEVMSVQLIGSEKFERENKSDSTKG